MLHQKKISSPIGILTLIASDTGLREVVFKNSSPKNESLKTNNDHPILVRAEKELHEYFSGKRKTFSVPLEIEGTNFQKKAWNALLNIPYGETTSYGEQASRIGNKKAVRAIGAANGRNPLPIVIPCHRVIASTGHLHGFGGGLPAKKKLLELENVKIQNLKIFR